MIHISEEMVEVIVGGEKVTVPLIEHATMYAIESFAMAVATHRHIVTSIDSEGDRGAIAEDLQQSLREAFGDDIANFYKIRVVNGDKPGHVMVEVRKKETL